MSEPSCSSVISLPDEAATIALARGLAPSVAQGAVIYLRGELGAGKTTFARALLQALGAGERIKSPTYSLLERYRIGERDAFHLDLYRIADAGELQWLGLDELREPSAIVLVEWPERGGGRLPPADLELTLEHARSRGRNARLQALTARIRQWVAANPPAVTSQAGR